MPERIIILNIETTEEPFTRRHACVTKINDFTTHVTLYSGFMDTRNVPRLLRGKSLAKYLEEKDAVYFVTNRTFTKRKDTRLNKVERFIFTTMHRNSSAAMVFFSLPTRRVATFSVTLEI